ncbi:hypothetical protein ACGFNV_33915 [Streptomyces sp. NPDC048751]|uniref:hypothetical protein n=1 Tax=Streptomyces sp. NPDC048751 TaxID=3365591 RepID=UPI00371E9362
MRPGRGSALWARVRSTGWCSSIGSWPRSCTSGIGEVRPLLAERGCTASPGVRPQTLAEVVDHLGSSGTTGIIDGTEIRARRPAAGRKDRDTFISGQMGDAVFDPDAAQDRTGGEVMEREQLERLLGAVMASGSMENNSRPVTTVWWSPASAGHPAGLRCKCCPAWDPESRFLLRPL